MVTTRLSATAVSLPRSLRDVPPLLGIQNSFYLEGEYNKHSKKVQYTYTLYNTALCQEDSVVMTAVYTYILCSNPHSLVPISSTATTRPTATSVCAPAGRFYYLVTANCTVSHPTYIATMVNNALADKIITCDEPWKNNAKKDILYVSLSPK